MVVRFDGTSDGFAAVTQGTLHATTAQNPTELGRQSVAVMAQVLAGETVEALQNVAVVVEAPTIAEEARGSVPEALVEAALPGTPIERVAREEIKARFPHAKLVIRTGETTPYANAILRCGVNFSPRLSCQRRWRRRTSSCATISECASR
ncbi:RbsD/FucU domain-containing protein [Microbacterium amylolyticum]